MKSDADFESLYKAQLSPILESLEASRKEVVAAFYAGITWLIFVALGVLAAVAIENPWVLLISVVPLIVAIMRFSVYNKKKQDYTMGFKEKVIGGMVKMMDENLSYSPQSLISSTEYCEADIFRDRIDSYSGGDLISGKLGATTCKFSELQHQEKQVYYDSKGRRYERWVTIFKGIFFIADFNKNFNGCTWIFPDSGSSFFGIGKLFEKWTMGRGELVKLEDPTFEKNFTVYGTDQVEARYILSTSLMERLVAFREKANATLHLSFIHSKVFIAISLNKNLFEPNIFSSGVQENYLKEYFHYLALVTGIVDDLNLNTRIWGKN